MGKLNLPKQVEWILDRLSDNGYEAFVVGGCVRDSLMGITPHDWDICTSAKPEDVMTVFAENKVIPTGVKHGTVTVVVDDSNFEITTYRIDGEYTDGRRPDDVSFTNSLRQDLMRRDFTINAMAYNHKVGLVDLFGGQRDIKKKIIRCVGDPQKRFEEDALRMLRAVRFAVNYNFSIETKTREYLSAEKGRIKNISAERVVAELYKILNSDLAGKDELLRQLLELLSEFIPAYKTVDQMKIVSVLSESIPILELRMAVLLDFKPESLAEVIDQLKLSNKTGDIIKDIRKFGWQIRCDLSQLVFGEVILTSNKYNKKDNKSAYRGYYARKLLSDAGYDVTIMAIEYVSATYSGCEAQKKALHNLEMEVGSEYLRRRGYRISDLAVNGNDMREIGYSGKEIKIILNILLDMVLRDAVKNDWMKLIGVAKSLKCVIQENHEVII